LSFVVVFYAFGFRLCGEIVACEHLIAQFEPDEGYRQSLQRVREYVSLPYILRIDVCGAE
jgi:hypothetical protein